jgi:hypothetical protein
MTARVSKHTESEEQRQREQSEAGSQRHQIGQLRSFKMRQIERQLQPIMQSH